MIKSFFIARETYATPELAVLMVEQDSVLCSSPNASINPWNEEDTGLNF